MEKFKTFLKNIICRSMIYISIGFIMTAFGFMSVHFFKLIIPVCIVIDFTYLYLSDRLFEKVCVNKKMVAGLVLSLFVFINLSSGFAYKNPKKSIMVLTYHRINSQTLESAVPTMTPKEFENQMQFLKNHGFTSVSSEDVDKYYKGEKVKLPRKPVLITFDDGWRDNYENALPILKKYGMKATIFLVTGRIGNSDYLTWDMAKAMEKDGISFGGHTRHHINMKNHQLDEDYNEIKQSYDDITENLGMSPRTFCYPYGGADMNHNVQKLVKKAGFDLAFASNNFGINMSNVNPYAVRRVLMPRYRFFHMAEMILLAW